MTSPIQKVEVRCPKCGHVFEDWYRPSVNLDLDPWADDKYLHDCVHATCPECSTEFNLGPQIVVIGRGESEEWRFHNAP